MRAEVLPVIVKHARGFSRALFDSRTGLLVGFNGHDGWLLKAGPRNMRKALRGLLRKAREWVDWRNDPSYRWITVHPHDDPEAPGYPVLIKVHPDGTAHVVAGAGGALTGMTLTRLRSPEEWRVEARARRQARGQTPEEIRERKEELRRQVELARAQALERAARALGWEETVRLPEEIAAQMDEKQRRRIERARARALERKLREAAEAVQDAVIEEHNEQVARALGDVPIEEVATPEVDASGKGYMDTVRELAEQNGLTEAEVKATQATVTSEGLLAAQELGYIESAARAEAFIEMLHEAGKEAREADRPYREAGVTRPDVGDVREQVRRNPEAAAEVLRAWAEYQQTVKQLRRAERMAQAAQGLDQEKIERGVALLSQVRPLSREEAEKAAEQMLSQRAMVQAVGRLMEEVEDFEENYGRIEQHILAARYAQLTALYERATGEPLPIDRRVCDLLGIDATASLAGDLLREKLGDRFEQVRDELIKLHVDTQVAKSRAAVERARQKIKAADELLEGLPSLDQADPDTLLMIQSRNREREQLLREAGEELGITLGQLEAAGHLNNALMGRPPKELRVSMGDISTRDAVTALRALGLEPDEYEIIGAGPNRLVRISREAARRKLVQQQDPEIARDYRDAQAIKRGDYDEEGWLPQGIKRRASTDYATDWQPAFEFEARPEFRGKSGEQLREAVRDYAAAMLANDGVGSARELRMQMLSEEFMRDHVDNREEYVAAVNAVLPPEVVENPEKAIPLTEELVRRYHERGETEAQALDTQAIDTSEAIYEVVHRTLAAMPEAKVAFTPLSQLTAEDRATLRDYFWEHITDEPRPEPQKTRQEREELQRRAQQVVGQQYDIFGQIHEIRYGETEAGQEALARAQEKEEKPNAWQRYVRACRGVDRAYANIQAIIRGQALERFAHEYRRQYGRELKLGREELPHADRHVVGLLSPEELAERLGGEREEWARLLAMVAKRQRGRFAAGERKELAEAVQRLQQLSQMRLFADRHLATSRATIGRTAEQQLRRIWSHIAPNFDPKRPVSIPVDVRMDGEYAPQQRAIKLVDRMKRVGLHLATGAGKTLVGLGAFAHLSSQGKVRRGIFVVPPKQGGQWGSEALRFLEPGRWRHFVAAGATAEERRRAYADPNVHIVIVGHQALRDDLTWAVAQVHFGGDIEAAKKALAAQLPKGASDEEREEFERRQRALVQSAVRRLGWHFDFSMLDEGHDALNRQGKPNSRLANALDAFTAAHEYHINATATPVKNDVSEVFDLLHKLRPDLYPLSRRREFMRKYGTTDIAGVAEALRREVAPYFYARQVDTGTRRRQHKRVVSMTPQQRRLYREIMDAYRTARRAQPGSREWEKAIARLLPPSELSGLTAEQRRARIERAARYLGSVRDHALARVVYGNDERLRPEEVGVFHDVLEVVRSHAHDDLDGGQLPGVVFAHSPGAARKLAKFLQAHGVRAGVIDGTLTSEEAEAVRQKFFPQGTLDPSDPRGSAARMRERAQYDVLVCTDAASHGLNLHRAAWLYHIDPPYTAKTHQQRNGRIDRIGQLHGEVHVYDAHHDAPYDRRRRQILQEKYPITQTFQTPYELLDQDETDTAATLVDERDARLHAATHVATVPDYELREARGNVPDVPLELLAQAARGEIELTPQQEYALQEAAGQQSLL